MPCKKPKDQDFMDIRNSLGSRFRVPYFRKPPSPGVYTIGFTRQPNKLSQSLAIRGLNGFSYFVHQFCPLFTMYQLLHWIQLLEVFTLLESVSHPSSFHSWGKSCVLSHPQCPSPFCFFVFSLSLFFLAFHFLCHKLPSFFFFFCLLSQVNFGTPNTLVDKNSCFKQSP